MRATWNREPKRCWPSLSVSAKKSPPMTMAHSWLILDTNIWIFSLREDPERPACMQVLQHLPQLYVHAPRQILLELRANLTKEEMGRLFRLLNRYPERIQIHWDYVAYCQCLSNGALDLMRRQ